MACIVLLARVFGGEERDGGLLPPFPVRAGQELVDVAGGHAAPFLHDLDGDCRLDLLVGQFEGGRLRLHPGTGSPGNPRFEAFRWFRARGSEGTVPAGCCPG